MELPARPAVAARIVEHRRLERRPLPCLKRCHRLAVGGLRLRVKRAGQNEQGKALIPFGEQPLGHLTIAQPPVARVRVRVEPVERDHLVETIFVAEPLKQREMPDGDPAVAAEELR